MRIEFKCKECGHEFSRSASFLAEMKPIRIAKDTYQFTAPFGGVSKCKSPSRSLIKGPCECEIFIMKDEDLMKLVAVLV